MNTFKSLSLCTVPDAIMDEYYLASLVINGHLYAEVRKGMYGLPEAGRLANDRLTKFLAPFGYAPVPITPGLWQHKTQNIAFTLVVDDFGVKYSDQRDAEHLMATLSQQYTASQDWEGTQYLGLTLEWDYENHTCDILMPVY